MDFDRTEPGSYQALQSVFGNFGSHGPTVEIQRRPYSVAWEIASNGKVIAAGIGDEKTRGGHLSKSEWGRGLGEFQLPFGQYQLKAVITAPLPELADLNPEIVISGGQEGAKTFQSPLVVVSVYIFLAGMLFLWWILGAYWLAVSLIWFLRRYRSRSVQTMSPNQLKQSDVKSAVEGAINQRKL